MMMKHIDDKRNPDLTVGQHILNYRIDQIEPLKEISAVYYALKHLKTGATVELVYKLVVYNEMKGTISPPDQVMARSIPKALYPLTTYRHNSGGEPSEVPLLTYDQLKEFHRRHYYPGNAFFYTYGKLPLQEHLAVIEEKILKQFTRIDPGTDVPSQPRWQNPRSVSYPSNRISPQRGHQHRRASRELSPKLIT